MENKFDQAKEFLATADSSILNIAAQYYHTFLKEETNTKTAVELLKLIASWDFQTDASKKINVLMNDDEYINLINENADLINKAIDGLINKKVETDVFYQEIWKYINENIALPEASDKFKAYMSLIYNPKTPYFKLPDTINISEEEYKTLIKQNLESLKKFIFINSLDYEKRTDAAYQILKLIDNCDSEKSKTVLISSILLFYEVQLEQLQRYLDEQEHQED